MSTGTTNTERQQAALRRAEELSGTNGSRTRRVAPDYIAPQASSYLIKFGANSG